MTVDGIFYNNKKEAGSAILEVIKKLKDNKPRAIGIYAGFKMGARNTGFDGTELILKNQATHTLQLGSDPQGNITRIDHVLEGIPQQINTCAMKIQDTRERLENAKDEVKKPFLQESELNTYVLRLNELNTLLSMEQSENTRGNTNDQENLDEMMEDMEMDAIDECEWEDQER